MALGTSTFLLLSETGPATALSLQHLIVLALNETPLMRHPFFQFSKLIEDIHFYLAMDFFMPVTETHYEDTHLYFSVDVLEKTAISNRKRKFTKYTHLIHSIPPRKHIEIFVKTRYLV